MKAIDIIIPVHKYNEEIEQLLKRCLSSVNEMANNAKKDNIKTNVMIVGTPDTPFIDVNSFIETPIAFDSFECYENTTSEYDFCSQVNYAVNEVCTSDYFMIVEFDDMVTPKWLNMSLPYIKERDKCPVFLPLVEIYNIETPNKPLNYMNEIGWSSSFVENELGSLNKNVLQDYCNFNITGAIFKRNEYIKAGGLKVSMKLSFGYELLLRLSHLYSEVYVVPKVGYFHFVNRKDSLTSYYHDTMTQEEGSWWINLAIEEFQYKKDRKKAYNPQK